MFRDDNDGATKGRGDLNPMSIQAILQFLQKQELHEAFFALQSESNITYCENYLKRGDILQSALDLYASDLMAEKDVDLNKNGADEEKGLLDNLAEDDETPGVCVTAVSQSREEKMNVTGLSWLFGKYLVSIAIDKKVRIYNGENSNFSTLGNDVDENGNVNLDVEDEEEFLNNMSSIVLFLNIATNSADLNLISEQDLEDAKSPLLAISVFQNIGFVSSMTGELFVLEFTENVGDEKNPVSLVKSLKLDFSKSTGGPGTNALGVSKPQPGRFSAIHVLPVEYCGEFAKSLNVLGLGKESVEIYTLKRKENSNAESVVPSNCFALDLDLNSLNWQIIRHKEIRPVNPLNAALFEVPIAACWLGKNYTKNENADSKSSYFSVFCRESCWLRNYKLDQDANTITLVQTKNLNPLKNDFVASFDVLDACYFPKKNQLLFCTDKSRVCLASMDLKELSEMKDTKDASTAGASSTSNSDEKPTPKKHANKALYESVDYLRNFYGAVIDGYDTPRCFFSNDGKYVYASSNAQKAERNSTAVGEVLVWDVDTQKEVLSFPLHKQKIRCMAVNYSCGFNECEDGLLSDAVATSSFDKFVKTLR